MVEQPKSYDYLHFWEGLGLESQFSIRKLDVFFLFRIYLCENPDRTTLR